MCLIPSHFSSSLSYFFTWPSLSLSLCPCILYPQVLHNFILFSLSIHRPPDLSQMCNRKNFGSCWHGLDLCIHYLIVLWPVLLFSIFESQFLISKIQGKNLRHSFFAYSRHSNGGSYYYNYFPLGKYFYQKPTCTSQLALKNFIFLPAPVEVTL